MSVLAGAAIKQRKVFFMPWVIDYIYKVKVNGPISSK